MSIPNNQAIIDDNPFAAPTTELAAEKFKRLPQAKLAAIAHGLQALNWTFIVACLMLAVCYGVPHSYLSGYIVGGLTSLAVGLLACVVLAMLFLVYPIAGSLLGAFSLFIPFTLGPSHCMRSTRELGNYWFDMGCRSEFSGRLTTSLKWRTNPTKLPTSLTWALNA